VCPPLRPGRLRSVARFVSGRDERRFPRSRKPRRRASTSGRSRSCSARSASRSAVTSASVRSSGASRRSSWAWSAGLSLSSLHAHGPRASLHRSELTQSR
jgi:hypothetical protein